MRVNEINEPTSTKGVLLKTGDRFYDGPLSGPMYKKVSRLDSKYPDTFDWGIYDRLYKRFGENQPRGGVTFKTNLKLVSGRTGH